MVTRIPHPKLGWAPNISSPIRYSATPIVDPIAAPAFGQHTVDVLREILDCDDAKLARLVNAGVIETALDAS